MKIQDLQQPYRALAEMRREQQINSEWVKKCEKYFKETNDLNLAFYWENTPEGGDWWKDLNECNTPEIPAESLAELKEWNPEFEAVLIAEQPKGEPDPRLFTAAVAAMQGMLANGNLTQNLFSNAELKGRIVGEVVAEYSVNYAKALLAELDKIN